MDRNTAARVRGVGLRPRPIFGRLLITLSVAALVAAAPASSAPGAAGAGGSAALLALPGHVHRLARAGMDAGEAPDATRMHGLDLVLARTPAQQKALDQLLADQQDPKSAQYHHWLSPAEFGRRFGASDSAIHALSGWLKSYGLEAGTVPASRSHLPFSGTKTQVEAAFHTQIHQIEVQGERHYSNVSDPMVPASVQPMIRSVRGLNDFNPKPGVKPSRPAPSAVSGAAAPGATAALGSGRGLLRPNAYYSGSGQYPGYVGPGDFAVIYNLKPLYQNNITGAGVTVAIAAQSDIDPSVLTSYWTAFGVAGPSFGLPAQSFSSMPVPAADGGSDPGRTKDGNEDEAYLDTEILGALAPGATLILVRDANASTAAQYVIDQNLAAVLNISFSTCESDLGSSGNMAVEAVYQQAVSEGITITVSSDDAGVAGCTAQTDLNTANDVKSNGFAVNGLASTPYDLAVGGTDFNDLDSNTDSLYWSTSNQSGTFESALSHVPEMAWNYSCANPVFAKAYANGDAIAFCNTATLGTVPNTFANPFIDISGGGGGVSSCTSADGAGNCTSGYAQPSWQANVAGIGNFSGRALPDVSMIATRWLVCSYEITTCNPANAPFQTGANDTIQVFDGTSASAPSVAAIVALIDQTQQITGSNADGRQGLINPKLYQAAGIEYASAATLAACSADQGAISSAACPFYDIVSGSNAQPCQVSSYAGSATGSLPASTCGNEGNAGYATGIMEVAGAQDYAASAGFDMATGLGSINAAGLVSTFVPAAPTGLAAAAAGAGALQLTWTASAATSSYSVYEGTSAGGESTTAAQQGVSGSPLTLTGLTAGQQYFFKLRAVNGAGVSVLSAEASGTVVPAVPAGLTATAGNASVSLAWTAAAGAKTYNVFDGKSSGGEGATPVMTGLTSPSASVSGLSNGTTYYFTVAAVDAGGASAQSPQADATPVAPGGGGGGGAIDWFALGGLAALGIGRSKRR